MSSFFHALFAVFSADFDSKKSKTPVFARVLEVSVNLDVTFWYFFRRPPQFCHVLCSFWRRFTLFFYFSLSILTQNWCMRAKLFHHISRSADSKLAGVYLHNKLLWTYYADAAFLKLSAVGIKVKNHRKYSHSNFEHSKTLKLQCFQGFWGFWYEIFAMRAAGCRPFRGLR